MADIITIRGLRSHSKASETYADVLFDYGDGIVLDIAVPVVYRRTGLDLRTDEEIAAHLEAIYEQMHPDKWEAWRNDQKASWEGDRGGVTKAFFEILASDVRWFESKDFPDNDNPKARIKAIKDRGYTIATRNRGRLYDHILLPIPVGLGFQYEYWSGKLRTRIIRTLGSYDAFEGKRGDPKHLLPDHKFPEIRWSRDTARESLEDISQDEVHRDFQLVSNQRNQQKREACRSCFQTGKRSYPMGIHFYYEGGSDWPNAVPTTGKAAEAGCVGCGWYDLEAWRQALIAKATGGS